MQLRFTDSHTCVEARCASMPTLGAQTSRCWARTWGTASMTQSRDGRVPRCCTQLAGGQGGVGEGAWAVHSRGVPQAAGVRWAPGVPWAGGTANGHCQEAVNDIPDAIEQYRFFRFDAFRFVDIAHG